MDWWDAMRGRDRAREEADAERARQAAREAQERGLDERAGQRPPKQPEAIQRAENERGPAERVWPSHAERFREMHDNPPAPQKPEQEREATRMEHTRTAQPAPSMGGAGLKFTNSRVQQPQRDFADEVLDQARANLAAEAEAKQQLERDQSSRKSIWADDMREAERQAAMERGRQQEQTLERDLSGPMERERGERTRWN